MSDYSWEHKFIKPLRRDMDAERFKLELLGLLQMEDKVERIRQIALLAPKYSMGASSLKEAMAMMKSRTQTAEVQILSFEELWDLESEGIEWMVPELLPVGETVLFVALPKVGKSKAAVDLAFCVATGESRFLGREVKRGKVLLICPDASPQSLKNEMQKRGFRKSDSKNIRIIPRWTIDQMSVLEKQLEDFRPDLVIIDSLKKITVGKEISENSDEFADNIYELSDLISRYRASAILIHHASKSNEAVGVGKARGSTAIVGACWGMWDLERIAKPDPNNKKKMIADPKCPKRIFTATSRDSEGTSLNIEFNVENNSFDFVSEVGVDEEEAKQQQSNSERLTNLFRNNPDRELSGPEIMELLGVERSQRGPIYNALGRMESKRLITSKPAPGDKRYNLYSLPDFEKTGTTNTVPARSALSIPPPPPTLTNSTDDYNSETITQYELENSHHNSHQLVINSSECDSLKTTEYIAQYGVDPIVISHQLSQGGGGVKCLSEDFIGTRTKNELAHSADPIAHTETLAPTPQNPVVKFEVGDRVEINQDYPGLDRHLIGQPATVTEDLGKGDFWIDFDSEIEMGGKLRKSRQISGEYLSLLSPATISAPIAPLTVEPQTVEAVPESIAPQTVTASKKRKEFKLGDRVVIAAPDNKDYRGAVGEIVVVFDDEHGEQECKVKLDKRVKGKSHYEISASRLMPEPIAPASEELPKKP